MTTQGVQSLGLIIALLVPGGLFLWSYERKASSYGRRDIKDRVIRLAAASVLLLTVTAPVAWYAYIEFWQGIISGEASYTWEWFWRWLFALAYLAVVVLLIGPVAAAGNKKFRSYLQEAESDQGIYERVICWIAKHTLEERPHPTAFDFIADKGPFIMRIETKSGKVLAGLFDNTGSGDSLRSSHASSNIHNPDIYLQQTILVGDDGEYLSDDGSPRLGQGGLYLRADTIESAQIIQEGETSDEKTGKENQEEQEEPEN